MAYGIPTVCSDERETGREKEKNKTHNRINGMVNLQIYVHKNRQRTTIDEIKYF